MQNIPFLALLIILGFLLGWFILERYAWEGIRFLTGSMTRRSRMMVRGLYLVLNGLAWLGLGVGILMSAQERTPQTMRYAGYILGYMTLMNFPKVIFVGILFIEDIERLGRKIGKRLFSPEERAPLPSRRKFISQMGLALASIPFTSVLYGIIKGRYDYKVHRLELTYKDLPDAFDGFTLTQISDIHSGSFDQREAVVRGVEMIQELKSDLILFTGDLVNDISAEIEPWLKDFEGLHAPFGKYSVLGNHDYGSSVRWESEFQKAADHQKLIDYHQTMGFRLLMNEHVKIEKDGVSLNLVGVENWGKPPFPQKGDLDKAIQNLDPGFQILMSHDPSHWEAKVLPNDLPVHLTLSGHTHGAQLGVETPSWRWSPVQYRYKQWAGLYEEGFQKLYVNRGFGFIGFPGRVGIWPEITQITLRKG